MSATPPSVTPLAYQTPVGLEPAAGEASIFRSGAVLVTPIHASLPYECVKCGKTSDGRPITKTFYWHPPLLALMIVFPGLLVYALVAICVRKKATLTFSLCHVHRRKKRNNAVITAAILLAAVGVWFGLAGVSPRGALPAVMIVGGIVLFLSGLIWGLATIPVLRPARIDRHVARYKGCSPDFLAQFSSVQ